MIDRERFNKLDEKRYDNEIVGKNLENSILIGKTRLIKKNCIICSRLFYIKEIGKGKPDMRILPNGSIARLKHCLTCSRECSLRLSRISRGQSV